jgi:hypothetical protein
MLSFFKFCYNNILKVNYNFNNNFYSHDSHTFEFIIKILIHKISPFVVQKIDALLSTKSGIRAAQIAGLRERSIASIGNRTMT